MINKDINIGEDVPQWFAMSATYRNEFKAQSILEGFGIRSYVASRIVVSKEKGRVREICRPLVSNLIFVYATERTLKEFKPKVPHLQYKIHTVDGKKKKIVVRDEDMEAFIRVTSSDGPCDCMEPEDERLRAGARIRISGGPLEGLEGTFLRARGGRKPMVFVTLEGCIAVGVTVDRKYVVPIG